MSQIPIHFKSTSTLELKEAVALVIDHPLSTLFHPVPVSLALWVWSKESTGQRSEGRRSKRSAILRLPPAVGQWLCVSLCSSSWWVAPVFQLRPLEVLATASLFPSGAEVVMALCSYIPLLHSPFLVGSLHSDSSFPNSPFIKLFQ